MVSARMRTCVALLLFPAWVDALHTAATRSFLRQGASDTTIPSFFIYNSSGRCIQGGWLILVEALANHPSRTLDEEQADFSLRCFRGAGPGFTSGWITTLPPRSPEKPYLLWGTPPQFGDHDQLRKDVLFVGYELRSRSDDRMAPLPGITFAPPHSIDNLKHYPRAAPDPSKPPKFFLTFSGKVNLGIWGSSYVRRDLLESLNRTLVNSGTLRNDVVLDFPGTQLTTSGREYGELFDTAYVLVPGGQGRWTYRLSEAVSACAIPVILADGLTLPYEELINWKAVSIRMPEGIARTDRYLAELPAAASARPSSLPASPRALQELDTGLGEAERRELSALLQINDIIEALPSDEAEIRAMRERVCDINDRYFSSMMKRGEAMLLSAAAYLQRRVRPQ